MNAVAIFTGSFAFAASLSMGVMNTSKDTGDIWSRLLLGTSRSEDKYSDLLLASASKENAAPILLMGLPKSGSEAIHNYFTCNQVRSSHYCCDKTTPTKTTKSESHSTVDSRMKFPCGEHQVTCGSCVLHNMQGDRSPLEGCGDYQVWSQFDVETTDPFSWFLPQHHALPLLHESYPNAAIILHRRQRAEDWAESILHWHSVTTRLFDSFQLELIQAKDLAPVPDKITYESLMSDMQDSLNRVMSDDEWKRKRQLLIRVYNQHTRKVKQFANDFNHPLLEVIVDDDKVGKQLEEAFHLSNSCWHFNAEEYANDWKNFSLPF